MRIDCVRWRHCSRVVGPLVGGALLLSGCAHHHQDDAATDEVNTYPANYKPEILAAMHAYLNDPTGIRDGGLADPALKPINGVQHFVACVRYNGKKNGKEYAGSKDIAAVFIAGRFDHFVDTPNTTKEICAGANYAPFPELGKLTR
jgi:hypothetical protein